MNTESLDRIMKLKVNAEALQGFHENFKEKYSNDSNCDKKGFGFGKDSRFSAFKISTSFDSWHGYYGNSSAYSSLSIDEKLMPFFVKALNILQKDIFKIAAEEMLKEANELMEKAEKEITNIQDQLNKIKGAK